MDQKDLMNQQRARNELSDDATLIRPAASTLPGYRCPPICTLSAQSALEKISETLTVRALSCSIDGLLSLDKVVHVCSFVAFEAERDDR
jgi:hypothetical protein